MTTNPIIAAGITSLFLFASAGTVEAALPKSTYFKNLSTEPVKVLYHSTDNAISLACQSPSHPFEDRNNLYVSVDDGLNALSISKSYIEKYWNTAGGKFSLPEDVISVACPA
jgi:hypothetical protein